MDFSKFCLGVGPMSRYVVDFCLQYSKKHDFPVMIIASRNQVDHDTGYAFSTPELAKYVRQHRDYDPERVLICRDHCGPYFSDRDHGLALEQALENCINTLHADCDAGFNLIHVDVSRIPESEQYRVAQILFDSALSQQPRMMFEFGTEDNTGLHREETLSKLRQQLEFVERYKPNIKFVVSQTGSLTKHTQVGTFELEPNHEIAQLIHEHGLLFKEHNADYLPESDVRMRRTAGIDSINIAPQLGAVQSQVMLKYGGKHPDLLSEFYSDVIRASFWAKWITKDVTSNDVKFAASAHYCYNYRSGRKLLAELQTNPEFLRELQDSLYHALDQYRLGMKV